MEILEEIVEDLSVIQVKEVSIPTDLSLSTTYRQSRENEDFEYKNELRKAFSDCVRHHEIILEYCRQFKDFQCPFLLAKLGNGGFLICFAAYITTVVSKQVFIQIPDLRGTI